MSSTHLSGNTIQQNMHIIWNPLTWLFPPLVLVTNYNPQLQKNKKQTLLGLLSMDMACQMDIFQYYHYMLNVNNRGWHPPGGTSCNIWQHPAMPGQCKPGSAGCMPPTLALSHAPSMQNATCRWGAECSFGIGISHESHHPSSFWGLFFFSKNAREV